MPNARGLSTPTEFHPLNRLGNESELSFHSPQSLLLGVYWIGGYDAEAIEASGIHACVDS
jgi:hypothetical protein